MNITILGSGTCVPSLKRSSCAFLLECCGTRLLFDSGAGTIRRLLEAGVGIFDVDAILCSHFHPDHTGELVSFLFSTKYSTAGKRGSELKIIGGPGFNAFYEGLYNVYGDWVALENDMLKVIELDGAGGTLSLGDMTVECAPVNHRPESIALKVISPSGKSVVYSGDTDVCDSLVEIADGADLFICESAVPDELKVSGHLTPSLAGEIARRAGVERLVLTHFYPECDAVDVEMQCRRTYDGRLILAEDLMRIEV